jgi:hypothetical protein
VSKQYFEVLSSDDVKRERVRGVFAIGVVAIMYYLRTIYGQSAIGGAILLVPAHLPYYSAVTSDQILTFWGLYVVGVAVALSAPKFTTERNTLRGKIVRELSGLAYFLACLFYCVAAVILFLVVLYYGIIVAFTLYRVVLPLIAIWLIYYLLRRPEHRQRISDAIRPKRLIS